MKRWRQFFKGEKTERTIHAIRFESPQDKRSYIQSAYKCFKRFGSVDTIRTGCVDCLFIQYKNVEDAAKLSKIVKIEIDHMGFGIFSADKFQDLQTGRCTHNGNIFVDPTNYDRAPIIADSTKNLLNALNDDCLREIFRNIHSLVDFRTVACVCKRFNKIAMEIFVLKIQRNTFALGELRVNGDVTLLRLSQFLTMFGSSIHAAHLNFHEVSFENIPNAANLALKMINMYCKNLRSLTIRFENNESQINWMEICSVLPMLKYLKIDIHRDVYNIDSFPEFISACYRLETLIINCGYNFPLHLPEITFPNLIKFKLPNNEYPQLDRFLKHNKQLEKIHCEFDHCPFIGENMMNLRKFTTQVGRIIEANMLATKLLKENVKLKLRYWFTDGDGIEYICQIKNVTTISAEIWKPFGANHLIMLAQSHKQLRKLKLYILDEKIKYPIDIIKPMLSFADQLAEIKIICRNGLRIQFNETDFEEILKVVERRNNSISLIINITNTLPSSGQWAKEKLFAFNDKLNRLNVTNHYVMPWSYF